MVAVHQVAQPASPRSPTDRSDESAGLWHVFKITTGYPPDRAAVEGIAVQIRTLAPGSAYRDLGTTGDAGQLYFRVPAGQQFSLAVQWPGGADGETPVVELNRRGAQEHTTGAAILDALLTLGRGYLDSRQSLGLAGATPKFRGASDPGPVRLKTGYYWLAGALQIHLPAAELPYGVVRVYLRDREHPDVLLGTFLAAVPTTAVGTMRSRRLSVGRWTNGYPLERIQDQVFAAIDDRVNLQLFPVAEVRALLGDPDVRDDLKLADDVKALCNRLERP